VRCSGSLKHLENESPTWTLTRQSPRRRPSAICGIGFAFPRGVLIALCIILVFAVQKSEGASLAVYQSNEFSESHVMRAPEVVPVENKSINPKTFGIVQDRRDVLNGSHYFRVVYSYVCRRFRLYDGLIPSVLVSIDRRFWKVSQCEVNTSSKQECGNSSEVFDCYHHARALDYGLGARCGTVGYLEAVGYQDWALCFCGNLNGIFRSPRLSLKGFKRAKGRENTRKACQNEKDIRKVCGRHHAAEIALRFGAGLLYLYWGCWLVRYSRQNWIGGTLFFSGLACFAMPIYHDCSSHHYNDDCNRAPRQSHRITVPQNIAW
jgi:hypothetical protein